ncbi:SigE family RNA polymerase sigma factor [Cellulomonas edaphi]|uniref:SigE family RNA polymerase sigma factor n=1 Tax=Cellulomonas edaphi TaxID=3053468 RepID=A0ABT7S2I1_9CELL|nr:SigE family RNA polymerase sigma factor [Cellulomons edaphi]MDM7829816.1 SigE family RNA polymerase sigma factor [Cellulomons edaphi]
MAEPGPQAQAAGAPVPPSSTIPARAGPAPDRDAEFSAFALSAQAELGRTAWLLTGDVHAAAELVQTALVRTYTAWPRAREGDPLAYARRTLANARIDTWRRRRREVLAAPDELPQRAGADEGAVVEQRDELVRALAALSPQQRRVVVLRYLVGLSEREVADDLGVSAGTVKTQASRGLHKLRASLGELS